MWILLCIKFAKRCILTFLKHTPQALLIDFAINITENQITFVSRVCNGIFLNGNVDLTEFTWGNGAPLSRDQSYKPIGQSLICLNWHDIELLIMIAQAQQTTRSRSINCNEKSRFQVSFFSCLMISSLYLSLFLSDRKRADTIITFHHPPTKNFLRTLELTYTEFASPYRRLLAGIPILAVFQNLRWNSNKKSL